MRHWLLLFSCLAVTASCHAQEARLSGAVTDPSGSVLPNVSVTATQTQRNVSFNATSDQEGRFLFPRLPIGPYEVKAGISGFKSFQQSGINLTTSADQLLNISLELGDVSSKITVSAEASRVSTESATVQQLVDSNRIVDLPLNGRNVYSLANLVPGVGPGGVNISGGRSGSQNSGMANVRIDGSLNVDNVFQQILPSPSPDAVQEFSIQTSLPSARYGYAAGVIEVSTKSGTNQFHGSIYEFLRNDKLDARNFFLPTKTKRKRNQYGFTGGGPVWLPRLYDGRNRTFWFVNFEQMKEPLGAPTTIFVPTGQQLTGDFSGQTRVIRDPNNNQAFPGNRIPASRLDPLALNFLREYVPQAQDSLGTYRYQRPADNNPSQFLVRLDQSLAGGRQQLSGRTFITRRKDPVGHGNLPAFQQGTTRLETDFYGVTHTASLSPDKINTARFSMNGWYSFADYRPKIELADLKKLGFAPNYYTYTPDFPVFAVTGAFTASIEQIFIPRDYNTLHFNDDFSWVRGSHNIQLGFDGIYTLQSDQNMSRTNGAYTFNGSFSGLGLTDFMIGRPSLFRQGSPAPDDVRVWHLAWYLQDDWKVNRRLTLNAGLRHELPRAPHARNNAAMAWRPGQQSRVYKNAPPGLLFYGDPDIPRPGRTVSNTLFAPRFGFAYALTSDQKTLLRAGYGIYINPSWSNIEGQFAIYQPFTRIIDLVAPPSTSNPWLGYPGGNPHPYKPGPEAIFDREIVGLSYGPNFKELTMQQWNLTLQRELAGNWLFTAGYVGSRGTHIPYLRDQNPATFIPGQSTLANLNQRRPLYPYFSRFSLMESVINSNYNSFQFSADRRFRAGFSLMVSYTFSKSLSDLNSVLTNTGGESDPDNRRLDWAPSNFDRTHALVTSWIWHVPSGGFRKGAAGLLFANWELNGIFSMYSGGPLEFTASQDRYLRGRPNRPDRLKDARLPLDRPRAELITQYFDRTAYAPNALGRPGSAPRAEGQIQAPGDINTTLGVFKRFPGFAESHHLQFRTEFFNLVNRPNFGAPGANIDAPASFGRVNSAGDGRIIQLALKYVF
ncbi:MAG: carboxypeptidase regulatory-like domain-containing protein [Acidobacteriota bacterium]